MIEIIPNDVLFFRESRDFTAGQAHVGRTIEPLPHTVAGALMGVLFARKAYGILNLDVSGDGSVKKLGEAGWSPSFSIEGVLFHDGRGPLFRIPMDIVETDMGTAELRTHLAPGRKEPAVYALIRGPVGPRKTFRFSPMEGFADWEFLSGYLAGNPPLERIPVWEPYIREERIGIALNGSKTTVQGMFYRTEFLRFREEMGKEDGKRAGIAVYLPEKDEELLRKHLGDEGTLKLGGESRFARFRFTDEKLPPTEGTTVDEGTIIRVYLATPAVGRFEDIRQSLERKLGKVEFLKLFTGRRLKVTGWDMVARKPKPLKYALPSGTVFWFRAKESLSLPGKLSVGEMTWAGYGLAFTGVLE